MEQLKKIITNLLLAFVFISIGFAIGKHTVKLDNETKKTSKRNNHHVAVYYLHSTFRCVTCNTIEEMTWTLLNSSYSNELTNKKIKWIIEDFQENETIAKKFEVVASCVVVALVKADKIIDFIRVDEVWTLMEKPEEFNNYLSNIIDSYLEKVEIDND